MRTTSFWRSLAILATSGALTVLVLGCCGGGGGGTTSTPTPSGDQCPSNFKSVTDKNGTTTCSCAANAVGGSVWGTDIYTTDSSICGAAVHAGVIEKAKGGKVTVKGAAGCSTYTGSARNGVSSSNWGSYDGSFYFPDKGDGTCGGDKKDKGDKVAKGDKDKEDDEEGGDDKCPDNFKSMKGFDAKGKNKLSCKCEKDQTGSGSVWGTGTYTTDSSICRAAVHAGVIKEKGGKVKVKSMDGCKKYTASEANGVSSSSWGSYDMSFYFTKNDKPSCAE